MFDYSAANILQSIRDLTYSGASNRDWSDDALLRLLNRELSAYLVPMMAAARKNHFATFLDIPLVAGQAAYWLPSKAAGMKARAVQLVDSGGQPYSKLREFDLEEAVNFGASFLTGVIQRGLPAGYYWRGNQLCLYPAPDGTQPLSLRVYFLNRPSTLVANAACVQLSSITPGSPTFTLGVTSGSIPAGYPNGTLCDLVQNSPGFDVLFSGTITSQTLTSLVFTGAVPPNLLVGDWVCLSDTAPVITGAIPEVVVGCLVKKVVLEVLSGTTDSEMFAKQRELLIRDEKRAQQYLNRRNTGAREVAGHGSLYRFRRGPTLW